MKENMALPPASLSFWKRKLSWKQSLTIILVMVCLALLGEMARGIKITFNNRWKEEGHAYDVKEEYYVALFAGGGRRILIEKGWNQDGMVPSLLHGIHGKAYESAMKIIPVTDGERELWYFNYVISPAIWKNNKNTVNIWMPEVLKTFTALVEKPIKSRWLRDVERYNSERILLNYFFNNKNSADLSLGQKQKWTEYFITEGIKLAKQMDIKKIASKNVHKMTPLQFIESLTIAVFQNIKEETFNCNQTDIKRFQQLSQSLRETLLFYNSIKLNSNDAATRNRLKENANTMHSIVSSILYQKCNVRI